MQGQTKVAFITNSFPALSTTFIYNEVRGLQERGLGIRVFSIRRPKPDDVSEEARDLYESTFYVFPLRILAIVVAHLTFILRRTVSYFRVLAYCLRVKNPENKTAGFQKRFATRTRTIWHFTEGVFLAWVICRDRDICHIHAHYASHPATMALVISELLGLPFSFTAHAYDIWEDKLFLQEKLDHASFVITCTKHGKRELVRGRVVDASKIFTVYHGVDTSLFKPKQTKRSLQDFVIVNIGRLHKDKAHDVLIKMCRELKARDVPFRCIVVGDGPQRHECEKLIEEYALQECVSLVGKVYHEKIREYYEMADAFVLTSVSENLPNVLPEAMAMGVPVVASNLSGIPELISSGHNGFLVKPRDVDGYVAAVLSLIRDDTLRRQIIQNGLQTVTTGFSLEKANDELFRIFSERVRPAH